MTLETLIDKIRINKFAECNAAIGIWAVVSEPSLLTIALGAINLGMSFYFARKQNKRYNGIVGGVKDKGYDKRFCSMYMDHPCGRSVVKTALKRTGYFDKYKELKKRYPLTTIC